MQSAAAATWMMEEPPRAVPGASGASPCAFVLLGASGDLSRRKLLPALYRLSLDGHLPAETAIIGAAMECLSTEAFRELARDAVARAPGMGRFDAAAWHAFARRLHYLPMDVSSAEDYRRLGALLERVERAHGTGGNRVLYLALAPGLHPAAVRHLGESGLGSPRAGFGRLVVEKPFGTDLPSARALNALIHRHFDEPSVFRMDHYLGKEMVQNLLYLRFANRLFEPLWSREHVDHVQITCAETAGVEGRGRYYEQAGVLRDMIQNHALQLLSLVAMEPPETLSPEAVHDAKMAVMAAARPFTPERIRAECVRGQYGPGLVAGRPVPGYREEEGVARGSGTDTFALLTMRFDNPRWAGVPFYVRSGKRLAQRATEVLVQLKDAPLRLLGSERSTANQLLFRIQPEEGASLRFATRAPGREARLQEAKLDFMYGGASPDRRAEAYERLLLDCMLGVSTHYVRTDLVERAWELVTPVMDAWAAPPAEEAFPNYAAGTWGPADGLRLLEDAGRRWSLG